MNVKEIIKISCLLLNKQNVLDYLSGGSPDSATLSTVANMSSLCNLVINELACTYVPMTKQEKVNFQSGKVYYTDLTERAVRIIDVTDTNGNSTPYQVTAEYVKCNYNASNIEYEFIPPNYDLEDEFSFSNPKVNARVLAYALCAEYCITEARFDEAVTWHKRYVDEICEICFPKNKSIKQRSWV